MENSELIEKYKQDEPKLTSKERSNGFVSKGLKVGENGELFFHFDSPREARHPDEYGESGEMMENVMYDIDERIGTFLDKINNETGIYLECQAD